MIKVFLEFDRIDFRGAPTTHFEMTYKWTIAQSAATNDEAPVTEVGTCVAAYAVDSQPSDVYQTVYDAVLAVCAARGWGTPAKSDIYAWLPTDFQTLIGP